MGAACSNQAMHIAKDTACRYFETSEVSAAVQMKILFF